MLKPSHAEQDTERDGTNAGSKQPSVRWALASLSLSMLLPSLDTSIANAGLPTLMQAFNASFQEVQWIVLAYLLSITSLIVGVGRLGDIIGRRRLLLVGIGLFTVASLLCGVAPTLWMLITARAAQGLGAAIMMALTVALVRETVPKSKTGSAMGLLGTMSAIGTTLGPSLGGVLIAGLGWRMIFLVNVPLGILNLFLADRTLPADRSGLRENRPSFDHRGTLLLAASLAAYALAMTIGRGHFGPLNIALLLGAACGFGFFVKVEARVASPLIRLAIFRDPVVSASLAMSMLVSTLMMTTLVVGPFYLSRGLGLETSLVGVALSMGPLVAALMGVPAGRMVDRFGGQRMTIIGVIGMTVGSTVLSMMPTSFHVAGYIAPIIVITSSFALFQAANNTVIMTGIHPDDRGVISGMLSLSRNLGLLTGASVMGAVFALAAGTTVITTARPEAVASGMRTTFAVAALLVAIALIIAIGSRILAMRPSFHIRNGKIIAIGVSVIGLLFWANGAEAQGAVQVTPIQSASANFKGTTTPGTDLPTPAAPYPLNAAGWGPEAGNGEFFSRWAEDWTGMRTVGDAPSLKAIPLGGEAFLTLSAEARLRYEAYENAPPTGVSDLQQGLFRGTFGADLRFNPNFRVYGEIGTGQVSDDRSEAAANYQNDASLQQLFMDARGYVGSTLVGAMVGRQEFADGPRQLISLSDGPNMHRTWNGLRVYAHGERFRFGAFDLRATRLENRLFDEEINRDERLQGLNASLIVSPELGIYLDPFCIHSENPNFASAGQTGLDNRDTYGVRFWGKRSGLSFDWTVACQTGESIGRDVEAWGLFAVQSLTLSDKGWKPRLTAHIDLASGGGAYGSGTVKRFNPLYSSSNYLGEGRFLSLSNLFQIAPGISVSPTATTNIAIEYGFARRLTDDDAAYAGGLRAYPGTQNVKGHEIGYLLRITGNWSVTENLTLSLDYEHLAAGEVLERAQLPSGSYGYVGATFRF